MRSRIAHRMEKQEFVLPACSTKSELLHQHYTKRGRCLSQKTRRTIALGMDGGKFQPVISSAACLETEYLVPAWRVITTQGNCLLLNLLLLLPLLSVSELESSKCNPLPDGREAKLLTNIVIMP